MPNPIWRDDDILMHDGMHVEHGVTAAFEKFIATHEILRKYGAKHTIAVLAAGIPYNPAWVKYINDYRDEFDIQLHGLIHLDVSDPANADQIEPNLKMAIAMMEIAFGQRPTVFYPPWNRIGDMAGFIRNKIGLRPEWKKISLEHYLEVGGNVEDGTAINFHYWADEIKFLEPALKIWSKQT